MSLVKCILILSYLLSSFCYGINNEYPDTGFIKQEMLVLNELVDYQVYLPVSYQAKKNWPLIVFLHGAGERGDNSELATKVGLGRAIRKQPYKFPAISVFPQCPAGQWWSSPICERIALQSVAEVKQRFLIDNKRIYLTGLSMGGYGVWHLASKTPDIWSALYVISGRVKPGGGHKAEKNSIAAKYSGELLYQMTANAVSHIPTWIAHGENDQVVPVMESRNMYRYLLQSNAQVSYSEYKGTQHNAWDKAYANYKAIDWLFAQTKIIGDDFDSTK